MSTAKSGTVLPTTEQGQRRVVLGHLRIDRTGSRRDVGRVRDQDVDLAGQVGGDAGVCVRGVAPAQLHLPTGRQPVHVARRPRQRRRVQLDGDDPDPGHLVGDRQRHGARAGAQVHDQGPVRPALPGHEGRLVDRQPGQHLGLRSRHEHPGADPQLDPPEGGHPGQVLQRLAGHPADQELFELLGLGRVDPVPAHRRREQLAPRDSEHVGGKLFGVGPGTGHPGPGKPAGGVAQQLVHGGAGGEVGAHGRSGAHAGVAESRLDSSASMQDCTTGSRSPSSTWSRLYAL